MSDQDNLDSLSNAEIRAKCIQNGLPNVPVTDSSRKILIKKLRVSLGGGTNSPAASSPKKNTNRRETIHSARQLLVEKPESDLSDAEQKSTPRGKGRRTIASTPVSNDSKSKESSPVPIASAPISERRRSVREQVLNKNVISANSEQRSEPLAEIAEETEVPKQPARSQPHPTTEVNVQRQQISHIPQRREQVVEQPSAPKQSVHKNIDTEQDPIHVTKRHYIVDQEPIVQLRKLTQDVIVERRQSAEQHAPITQRRNSNPLEPPVRQNTLMHNSLIVLESDEEEEEELARVAQLAEKQQRSEQSHKTHKPLPSLGSISASVYRSSALFPQTQYGSNFSKDAIETQASTDVAAIKPSIYGTSRYSSAATTSKPSYAPPLKRSDFMVNAAISAASSPYGSQRATIPACGNEYSDDTDGNDQSESENISTPYLSSFARNLERLKVEPLSGTAGASDTPRNRRTVASVGGQYEPATRRPLRQNDDDVSNALRRLWYSLDRKYKLKWKLIMLLSIIFVIILYVIFF